MGVGKQVPLRRDHTAVAWGTPQITWLFWGICSLKLSWLLWLLSTDKILWWPCCPPLLTFSLGGGGGFKTLAIVFLQVPPSRRWCLGSLRRRQGKHWDHSQIKPAFQRLASCIRSRVPTLQYYTDGCHDDDAQYWVKMHHAAVRDCVTI